MFNKAVDMLEKELEKKHSPYVPAIPIINYLISKCKDDAEFAKRVTLENKTLEECLEYVLQEVKKKLNNKSGWIDDQEVYDMAVTYYVSDDIKIEKPEDKYKKIKEKYEKTKDTINNIKNTVTMKNPPANNQLSLFDM